MKEIQDNLWKRIVVIFLVTILCTTGVYLFPSVTACINELPVANPNGPYDGCVGELIQFDGSESYDPDGTIVDYAWDFGDGNTGSGETPSHAYDNAGIYTVSLNVTDDLGGTDENSTTVDIIVCGCLQPPVADPNGPYTGDCYEPVLFNGSASYDPDGTIESYAWDFGDGNTGSGETPSHTYNDCGIYNVSLQVTDNDGLTDTASTTAIISCINLVVNKTVWNGDMWVDDIRVPNGTTLKFKIEITNLANCPIDCLTVTDYLSQPQLEYISGSSSYPTVFESANEVRWQITALESGQTIEIIYNASTVHFCYGSNCVYVKDSRGAVVGYDLTHVKVVEDASKPALTISKQVWDERKEEWTNYLTLVKEQIVMFKITISSTDLYTVNNVMMTDVIPVFMVYNLDASHTPTSVSNHEVIWSLGNIVPGDEIEITYTATTELMGDDNPGAFVISNEGFYDEDFVVLKIDPAPDLTILSPSYNETLHDTVQIQWNAYDNQDGNHLPIWIYVRQIDEISWSAFPNNPYENTGILNWDTTSLDDDSYQLRLIAQDRNNNVIKVESNQFQIKNTETPSENLPPLTPEKPIGSTEGNSKTEYTYQTSTIDPEGDQVSYKWDWGDGTTSEWLGPFNSGDIISTTHIWDTKGSYNVKVIAKDTNEHMSDWSDQLPITMPYKFQPLLQFFEKLLERFPHLFPLLRHLFGY